MKNAVDYLRNAGVAVEIKDDRQEMDFRKFVKKSSGEKVPKRYYEEGQKYPAYFFVTQIGVINLIMFANKIHDITPHGTPCGALDFCEKVIGCDEFIKEIKQ